MTLYDIVTSYQPKNNVKPTLKLLLGNVYFDKMQINWCRNFQEQLPPVGDSEMFYVSIKIFQKQPFKDVDVLQNRCSYKFCKIHKKMCVPLLVLFFREVF